MPRKMIVQTSDGSPVLVESPASDEAQLQELVKDNPDLLPVEEFGMAGPLMVVGRETTLPSGAVDLVALARSGELLVIEFKTGPQNTDFRQALAQLLDYGSDLWGMSYEDFEQTVAVRYFAGDRYHDQTARRPASLEQATAATWPDLSEEEATRIRDRLSQQLSSGAFHYVLVAQRFTHTIERTMEYLNGVTLNVNFYAVELVHFTGTDLSAFESRTVLKPRSGTDSRRPTSTNESEFLKQVHDEQYRAAVRELFEVCRGLGLRSEWGAVGASIRVSTADRAEPLTIAWLFPPGRVGWLGLTDLTMGFDPASAKSCPSARPALDEYVAAVGRLTDIEQAKPQSLSGYRLSPEVAMSSQHEIAEILAELVRRIREQSHAT